ncbi:MAG: hypothetical protein ACRDXX_04245, partial [Stackebrandtia sp.]
MSSTEFDDVDVTELHRASGCDVDNLPHLQLQSTSGWRLCHAQDVKKTQLDERHSAVAGADVLVGRFGDAFGGELGKLLAYMDTVGGVTFAHSQALRRVETRVGEVQKSLDEHHRKHRDAGDDDEREEINRQARQDYQAAVDLYLEEATTLQQAPEYDGARKPISPDQGQPAWQPRQDAAGGPLTDAGPAAARPDAAVASSAGPQLQSLGTP